MPTIPMPDAATLAAWEARGLIPPATQRKPADPTPRRAKVAGGEIGPQIARRKRRRGITEAAWQRQVVELAKLHGWEVYHVPDSRRVTAGGWVDLVLGHETRGVVFAELKREGEKPRPDQVWWHTVLMAAGCRVFVWRPSDWDEVVRVLGNTTQQG